MKLRSIRLALKIIALITRDEITMRIHSDNTRIEPPPVTAVLRDDEFYRGKNSVENAPETRYYSVYNNLCTIIRRVYEFHVYVYLLYYFTGKRVMPIVYGPI